MQIIVATGLFVLLHACVWFCNNTQFIEGMEKSSALLICVCLSVPTALLGYYASRYTFDTFGSVWSIKLFGFGIGYLVFPILTWVLLKESPFTLKTCLSIAFAFAIIGIQLFLPDN
tara:strand:- start:2865 stop:3212 length:348 start_codon:yes stop_codon:yes gene_type:complete